MSDDVKHARNETRRHSISAGDTKKERSNRRLSSRVKDSVTDLFVHKRSTDHTSSGETPNPSSGDETMTPRDSPLAQHREEDEVLRAALLLAQFPVPMYAVPKLSLNDTDANRCTTDTISTTPPGQQSSWREGRRTPPSQPTTPHEQNDSNEQQQQQRARSQSNTMNSHSIVATENRRLNLEIVHLDARLKLLEQEHKVFCNQQLAMQKTYWQENREQESQSLCDEWCVLW